MAIFGPFPPQQKLLARYRLWVYEFETFLGALQTTHQVLSKKPSPTPKQYLLAQAIGHMFAHPHFNILKAILTSYCVTEVYQWKLSFLFFIGIHNIGISFNFRITKRREKFTQGRLFVMFLVNRMHNHYFRMSKKGGLGLLKECTQPPLQKVDKFVRPQLWSWIGFDLIIIQHHVNL